MDHPRLKEHYENEVRLDRLHIFVLTPSIIAMVFGLVILMTGLLYIWCGVMCTILALVGIIFAGHCLVESRNYRYVEEDYIMIKIMDVITEAVGSDDFEIIYDNNGNHNVAFHNVKVDYEKVQEKVDKELCIMNKIAHKGFRIKLL